MSNSHHQQQQQQQHSQRAALDRLFATDSALSVAFGVLALAAPHVFIAKLAAGYNHSVHETLRCVLNAIICMAAVSALTCRLNNCCLRRAALLRSFHRSRSPFLFSLSLSLHLLLLVCTLACAWRVDGSCGTSGASTTGSFGVVFVKLCWSATFCRRWWFCEHNLPIGM